MRFSFFKNLTARRAVTFKITLTLFLVLFPVLIGNLSSDFQIIESQAKNYGIYYSPLNQILLDLNSGYDQASLFKGIKTQRASFNVLNGIYAKQYTSGLKYNTRCFPFELQHISKYAFTAQFLLLDMPPPFNRIS